jgi:hypothetical protein
MPGLVVEHTRDALMVLEDVSRFATTTVPPATGHGRDAGKTFQLVALVAQRDFPITRSPFAPTTCYR